MSTITAIRVDDEAQAWVDGTIDAIAALALSKCPEADGAVVVTPSEVRLSAERLDLMVMLFSHVVITERDYGSHYLDDLDSRTRERFDCYRDVGILTPVFQATVDRPESAATGGRGLSIPQLIDELGIDQYEAYMALEASAEVKVARAMRSSALRDQYRADVSRHADFGDLLEAFARRDELARLLGATPLGDPRYQHFRAPLLATSGPTLGLRDDAVLNCETWLGVANHHVPRMDNPERILEWRRDLSRWDFINAAVELARESVGRSQTERVQHATEHLERHLERAGALRSMKPNHLSVTLAALAAGLGGAVGGHMGAALSAASTLVGSHLPKEVQRRRVRGWSAYFMGVEDLG